METTRMLKRNPESTKTLSRPQSIVTQPKEEPAKPQPTPNTGVGGSSLDTMTSACATEMMNAAISFHKLHLKVTGPGSFAAHTALGAFYEGLHDHADTLVEGYQGVAEKILTERNISIPIFDENYSSPKIPFYKSHPIWFWTFFGAGVTVLTRLIQKIANSF
jgi:hypothetical protein